MQKILQGLASRQCGSAAQADPASRSRSGENKLLSLMVPPWTKTLLSRTRAKDEKCNVGRLRLLLLATECFWKGDFTGAIEQSVEETTRLWVGKHHHLHFSVVSLQLCREWLAPERKSLSLLTPPMALQSENPSRCSPCQWRCLREEKRSLGMVQKNYMPRQCPLFSSFIASSCWKECTRLQS